MEFMIILIACVVAGLICLGLYSSMKPVSRQQSAGQYVSQERLVMSINEDNFIRETESRTRIVNQSAPGMAAGSAGANPGQNMTISASAPGQATGQGSPFTIHGQGFGHGQGLGHGQGSGQSQIFGQGHTQGQNHGGAFIDLTGGAGRPGARPGAGSQTGQQIHFGQHGQSGQSGLHGVHGQQNAAGSANTSHKPGYIDLSRGGKKHSDKG